MIDISDISLGDAMSIGNDSNAPLNMASIIKHGMMKNHGFGLISNNNKPVGIIEYEFVDGNVELCGIHEDTEWSKSTWSKSRTVQKKMDKFLNAPRSEIVFYNC